MILVCHLLYIHIYIYIYIYTHTHTHTHTHKVKQSRYRPGLAQSVPGGLGSPISLTFGTWKWWGCQPHAPLGMFLVVIFTRGWVDPRAMVQSEGSMSLTNPVTPPGIDPGTVRLVAQRLNHYATPDPYIYIYIYTRTYIHVYIYMCVCVCVCVCICMYTVYIYIYIYIIKNSEIFH